MEVKKKWWGKNLERKSERYWETKSVNEGVDSPLETGEQKL